jgi:fatty-acyl-CoA synthase
MSTPNYQLLIKHMLANCAAQASRKHVVYKGERRFTYPAFISRVHRLGAALAARGAGFGSRIAVMDWDSHRYLESYFAIPMLGATIMMVNIRLSPEQIAYTIDHADAQIILLNRDFVPLFDAIKPKLTKLKTIIYLSDDETIDEYESMLAAAADHYDFKNFDENTTATTFYTTGTTGLPKGVYFSHRQIVLHTLTLMSTIMMAGVNGRISREDVYMPLTPLFHVHGWGFPYAATMIGMQQIYTGRFLPATVLKLLATENVTMTHSVPTILHMLLTAPEAAAIDFSKLKMIIGGSALPGSLCRAAMARGIDVYTGYGMSESGPILSISQLTQDLLKDCTTQDDEIALRTAAGQPGVLIELAIMDDNLNILPRNSQNTGEIVARGPCLTAGYTKDAESSATLWRGGWLHTGDIGHFAANGMLHILDRSKDVIKTGGEWISSLTLEDVIMSHPAVSECAVISVSDPRWGERPLAIVVLKPDQKATEDELKSLVRNKTESGALSRYAIPDHIIFAPSLEKTSVGKLDKKKLRTLYTTTQAA